MWGEDRMKDGTWGAGWRMLNWAAEEHRAVAALVMVCCVVGSPLHSLLPSLSKIQGRRKRKGRKLSAETTQGEARPGCACTRSFHRHSLALLRGAEHLTLPQLSLQTTQPNPLPPPSAHPQGHWGSMTG